MWGTTSQTRRVLPQLLRNGDVRMVRAKNGVEPTHTTGDRLWEITDRQALTTVQHAYASDVTMTELSGPYLAEFPSRPCFQLRFVALAKHKPYYDEKRVLGFALIR